MTRHNVLSEVTGRVWKIEAAVGATVAHDDSVMIVESMKMEIPICSPAGGTVVEVLVAEGEAVEEGQTVAVVEG